MDGAYADQPDGNGWPRQRLALGLGARKRRWMLQNAYDCYTFSGDVTLLAKEIYPMMEECARLWTQLLIFDAKSGRMVSSPSFSPENGPVTAGDTYDQELVWQLYTDVLELRVYWQKTVGRLAGSGAA